MRYTSHFVVALMLLANVASVHAGWNYGGLKITSVRDNQTVNARDLMFTSGTILANSPSNRVTGTRVVTAYAGNRDSHGVFVPSTYGSTYVNRFVRYWNVRLDGNRVTKNVARRGFVYVTSRYAGSSSVHSWAMVDGLTFR